MPQHSQKHLEIDEILKKKRLEIYQIIKKIKKPIDNLSQNFNH
jgi:hypothetical protein